MASTFKFLTADDEAKLFTLAQRRRYADSERIITENERARCLFILRNGVARVERSHGDFDVEISVLSAGEIFGEMGLIEESAASASVIAVGDCDVDLVSDDIVQTAMSDDPGLAARFYQSVAYLLSRRLRATTVEALSEFAWGTGGFARAPEQEADEPVQPWGGGSPLRDDPASP